MGSCHASRRHWPNNAAPPTSPPDNEGGLASTTPPPMVPPLTSLQPATSPTATSDAKLTTTHWSRWHMLKATRRQSQSVSCHYCAHPAWICLHPRTHHAEDLPCQPAPQPHPLAQHIRQLSPSTSLRFFNPHTRPSRMTCPRKRAIAHISAWVKQFGDAILFDATRKKGHSINQASAYEI